MTSLLQQQTAWYDSASQQLASKAREKVRGKSTKHVQAATAEAKARTAALATNADKTGISFSGAIFQAEYFVSKFKRRGMLCHLVLEDLVVALRLKYPPPLLLTAVQWHDKLHTLYVSVGDPFGKDGQTLKSSEKNVVKVLQKYRGREITLFRELFRRYSIPEEEHSDYNLPQAQCCLGNIPSFRELESKMKRSTHKVQVASFGGGPGTDAAGLVWFHKNHPELSFECVLYDNEASWKRYTKTLNRLFGDDVQCSFEKCDVTAPLPEESILPGFLDEQQELKALEEETKDYSVYIPHDVNTHVSVNAAQFDIFLFYYVVHETARAAAATNYIFYRDLSLRAKEGAILVICDVMEHSRGVIEDVMETMRGVREIVILDEKRFDDTVRNTTESVVVRLGPFVVTADS